MGGFASVSGVGCWMLGCLCLTSNTLQNLFRPLLAVGEEGFDLRGHGSGANQAERQSGRQLVGHVIGQLGDAVQFAEEMTMAPGTERARALLVSELARAIKHHDL